VANAATKEAAQSAVIVVLVPLPNRNMHIRCTNMKKSNPEKCLRVGPPQRYAPARL
jgi:hypothetical protein